MTDVQKEQIIGYRKQGYGYKKIAGLMGISQNTVKTFCKRNGYSGVAKEQQAEEGSAVCRCCGKPVTSIPGRKPKKFCSDRCRNRWWNSHLELVQKKANYEYVCLNCKKTFTVYGNANRKYCSHECYIEDRFGGGRHE